MDIHKNYKGGQLSGIVVESLKKFFEKIKKNGIKKTVESFMPGIDADEFVLLKIRNQLKKRRGIELAHGLGRVDIQYRFGGVQIEFVGIIRYLIKKVTITDEQIIKSFDSIIKQIEENYIFDDSYITKKIDDVICHLSDTEIYKPETSEEKTFYDLATLILLNYYDDIEETPHWIKPAIENISQGEFIEKWIEILAKYISEVITTMSEDIFFDFKVTFESVLIRGFLNKKTNKGQISRLLGMFDININDIIYKFVANYVSPSFIKGASEILADIAGSLLSDFFETKDEKFKNISLQPFNITMTLGENPESSRNFRWFTGSGLSCGYLEYSYDFDFKNSFTAQAKCEKVFKTFPVLNFGLVSRYKLVEISEYSVAIGNLKPGTVYYRVVCGENQNYKSKVYKFNILHVENKFKFMIFADSQGMVKSDYEVFLGMAKKAMQKEKNADFLVHLGDFVDDGNNEDYWKWILSSDIWRENATAPLAGNHEARISAVAHKAKVKNSIDGHFNLHNFPEQDKSAGVYYSFVYKNATFVVLNTNTKSESGLDSVQYKWALDVLKNAKTKWKIILTHKSPYSNGPHHKDSDVKKIGKQINNLAYYGGVDVVFGGHDHVYVRTPFLTQGSAIGSVSKLINFSGETYETYKSPYGTMFVVPSTSGVKNYRQHFPIDFPAEKILNIKNPVYSCVEIENDNLYFNSYEFCADTQSFKKIDSFAIDKNLKSSVDSKSVSRCIDAIPDMPWIDNTDAINYAFEMYKSLDYKEKVEVNNYSRLLKINKMNESYRLMQNLEIRAVKNKREFLEALKDDNVGTIITKCSEITFKNKFCFIVNRPLCISGEAKISNIYFTLQENAFFVLSGRVCIDNTSKPFSLCFAKDTFTMLNNSVFILNEDSTINSGFRVGKNGYGVNAIGENTHVYLNSSGHNYVSKGVVFAGAKSSKLVVNSGKYFCSSGQYALLTNGILNFKNGFARAIKGYGDSKINIFGGIIGEKSKPCHLVPIESFGMVNINSGIINERCGVSVFMHDKTKSNAKILRHSVDIKGKIVYNE